MTRPVHDKCSNYRIIKFQIDLLANKCFISLCIVIFLIYRLFWYHAYKFSGCVGGTEMAWNQIAMKSRKYCNCELWCKKAEKKNRNSSVLMRQETFYWKVVLQKMFKAMTRSCQVGLTAALHEIPYILKSQTSIVDGKKCERKELSEYKEFYASWLSRLSDDFWS